MKEIIFRFTNNDDFNTVKSELLDEFDTEEASIELNTEDKLVVLVKKIEE